MKSRKGVLLSSAQDWAAAAAAVAAKGTEYDKED